MLTRVTQITASLIDHIHINIPDKICQAGVIETWLINHFITYFTRKIIRSQTNKHNTIAIRSMKNYIEYSLIEKSKIWIGL